MQHGIHWSDSRNTLRMFPEIFRHVHHSENYLNLFDILLIWACRHYSPIVLVGIPVLWHSAAVALLSLSLWFLLSLWFCAMLWCALLCSALLCCALLYCAMLYCAMLCCVPLYCALLCSALFVSAPLCSALLPRLLARSSRRRIERR